MLLTQTHVSLLQTIGPDQGIDLEGLDVIHLVDSTANVIFIGTYINNEDESIIFFYLLHGRFSG